MAESMMPLYIAIETVSGKTPTYIVINSTTYYQLSSTTYFTLVSSSTIVGGYTCHLYLCTDNVTDASRSAIRGGVAWVCDRSNNIGQSAYADYANVNASPYSTYVWYGGSNMTYNSDVCHIYSTSTTTTIYSDYNNWKEISGTPQIIGNITSGYKYRPSDGSGSIDTTNIGITYTPGAAGTIIYMLGYKANGCTLTSYVGLSNTTSDASQTGVNYWVRQNNAVQFPYTVSGTPIPSRMICSSTDNEMVISYHNINASTKSIYPKWAGSASSSNVPYVEIGRTEYAGFNYWATIDSKDGTKKYFAYTTRTSNRFDGTSFSVTAGYKYTFAIGTFSQANCDGIIISSTPLTSSSSVTNAGFARCSGVHVTSANLYTPSSNGTVYIYFKTDNDGKLGEKVAYNQSTHDYNYSGYTYGNVQVTIEPCTYTCTFNANGGTVGTSSTTVTYGKLSAIVVTPPTRSGYTFLGYYDTYSISGGNRYFDSDGEMCKAWDKTSNTTLYARWRVNLTYTLLGDDTNPVEVWCNQSSVVATNTTNETVTATISDGATCVQSVSYTVSGAGLPSGWSLSSDGKTISIPSGTSAGSYPTGTVPFVIQAIVPSGSNYVGTSVSRPLKILLKGTTVTYGTPTLTVGQSTDLPASAITLTTSNVTSYLTYTTQQQVTCSNGKSRNGSVTVSCTNGPSLSISSLGTTLSSRSQLNILNHSSNTSHIPYTIVATGEGSKTAAQYVSSLYRSANAVTNSNTNPSDYWSSVTISNKAGLTAAGGSSAVSATAGHKANNTYTSGSVDTIKHDVTDNATWAITTQTFTPSGGSASTITRFSKSSNTLSHSTMGTNVGTDTVVVTATNSTSGTTGGTDTASISNAVTNSDYNASNSDYVVDTVTIGSGLGAGTTEATVTVTGHHTHTYYYYYTSGSTSGPYTSTPSDTPTWSVTSQYINSSGNTITRFSKDGSKLKHATMGTTTGTDYVTITANNNGGTKTASTNVTNAVTGYTDYQNPTGLTISASVVPASGGTSTITWSSTTCSQQAKAVYTSGSTASSYTTLTVTPSKSISGNSAVSSKGTTISNQTTAIATVTGTYSANGKSNSTTCSVSQAANYVTAITPKKNDGTDGTHFYYNNIAAGDTSASPSYSGGGLYTFSSGSTKFDSSGSPSFGGTATYTRNNYTLGTVQNGFTAVNKTSGVLTATHRGSTVGAARTSGTVTGTLVITYTHASSYSAGGTVTSSTKTSTATCIQGLNEVTAIVLAIGGTTGTKNIIYNESYSYTVKATYTSGTTNVDITSSVTNVTSSDSTVVTIS